ncbi:MAG: glycosyltransferase family 2 protein [Thermodesulfobacteriota bacterium]|nr:glycosyltransferase family 2 protein [Thermodesulfobacteriota bacterium]
MEISVLILTLNEEENLPNCLASLDWCDDVVVLDSFSSDRTEQLATKAGAHFFQRSFDNYATQRNYGLNKISYKHDWLLMVDGDETVSPELVAEMYNVLASGKKETTIYRMRRKDFFLGKWIKRSSGYPTWFGRLMKIGHVRVERSINEEYVTDGEIGYLQEHLHHYPFNKGFSAWIEKHNRYSTMEAELLVQNSVNKPNLKELRSKDPALRRRAIKSFFYRLPGRPLLMFIALYFFRGGILDGRAGFTFCSLRAIYEYMINLKVKELRRRGKNLPV